MKPNWFIGLPVAADRWFDRVAAPPRSVRSMHRDDLHATVAFLGPVDEAAAHRAFDALAIDLAPLDVTLGAVVAMGDPHRYSALSALLDRGRVEVERASGACRERAWSAAGSALDRRPPKAHVTIARPDRRASARERSAGLQWASALVIDPVEIHVDRVALYTWSETRADRSAPSFRVERTQPLGR
jgi:2'-5' RNA ligase